MTITEVQLMNTEYSINPSNFIPLNAETLIDQVGMMNIYAISGGRVLIRETGITLKVRYGYSVEIDLAANDTYTVQRIFTKAGKRFVKGV